MSDDPMNPMGHQYHISTELVHSEYVAETTAEIMRLRAQLAAAEKQIAALRADAERYRWLRANNWFRLMGSMPPRAEKP